MVSRTVLSRVLRNAARNPVSILAYSLGKYCSIPPTAAPAIVRNGT